jgi:hypothetical protein
VIDEVHESIKGEFSDRTLCIQTEDGEKYEIDLWARSPEMLEIQEKKENDWLNPKVYKGKKEE